MHRVKFYNYLKKNIISFFIMFRNLIIISINFPVKRKKNYFNFDLIPKLLRSWLRLLNFNFKTCATIPKVFFIGDKSN